MTLPPGASQASAVSGGSINDAYRVTLADGREAFVKTRQETIPGEYAAEAAGLAWLAEPGHVRTPAVLEVDEALPGARVDRARAPERDRRRGAGPRTCPDTPGGFGRFGVRRRSCRHRRVRLAGALQRARAGLAWRSMPSVACCHWPASQASVVRSRRAVWLPWSGYASESLRCAAQPSPRRVCMGTSGRAT